MLNKVNGNELVLGVMKNLLDFSGKVMFDGACVAFLVQQVHSILIIHVQVFTGT